MTQLIDTAIALTQLGYSVVPTRADGTKAPAGDWKRWQKERPTEQHIRAWLGNGHYDGIGLVCGAVSGNLEMLELEGRAIAEGISARMAEIAEASGLAELWSRIVTGYSETSPSGGIHFLYRVDGPVAGNTKLARRPATPEELKANPDEKLYVLVETRGEGGYVIIAPSNGRTHPSGKPWTILAGGIDTIPTITEDDRDALHILARAVDQMPAEQPGMKSGINSPPKSDDGPGVADDYNQRTSWDDLLIGEGWTKVYTAGQTTYWRRPGKNQGISATTGRNDGDNLYVFSTSTVFEQEKAYSKFAAYALLDYGGDLSAAGKALYKAGYGKRATKIEDIIDLPRAGQEQPTEAEKAERDHEADLANARWLVHMHGDRMRYVMPWKKWLIWDGTRWAVDDTGQVWRYAKQVSDTLPSKHKGRTARAQTKVGIRDMLELAATEPGIAVAPSQLDADPHLLNVANGTLDLRTGELRPHDPAELLTKICNAAYQADAAAPEFVKFLERVQPERSMRSFLARLFGHALLGKVIEHILAVFYGTGANGKSTLVESIAWVIGDYADTIEPGLLIDRGEAHPTGVADLFGLRLAITHETDEGRRLAEGTVKRLTGGDRVKARRMREDFWSFDPSHSIVMHTNHKPIVRGTDEGIWRRLRFVPFNVVIPENERDGKLPERIRLEADGILAWLVAGYKQWLSRGLAEPQQVTDATAAFRGESDMLALFLEERCLLNAYAHVRSSELFATWVEWCRKENIEAGTQTAFSRELTDRGYDKKRGTGGGVVWLGIGLLSNETDTE
jgi:putative DNA primase/helicase